MGVNADGDEGYYYSPEKLTPKQGDTVVFSFSGSEHSVAQSTFDEPCEYVDNGINSGFPGAVSLPMITTIISGAIGAMGAMGAIGARGCAS